MLRQQPVQGRRDAELVVANSEETVRSCEGTTQGGSESGGYYACGITPSVDKTSAILPVMKKAETSLLRKSGLEQMLL